MFSLYYLTHTHPLLHFFCALPTPPSVLISLRITFSSNSIQLIYSHAVYILLSGCFPFPSADPERLTHQILAGVHFPSPEFDQISTAAKEFVRALLDPERGRRPTAIQCLHLPWLESASTMTGEYPLHLEVET